MEHNQLVGLKSDPLFRGRYGGVNLRTQELCIVVDEPGNTGYHYLACPFFPPDQVVKLDGYAFKGVKR